MPFGVPVVKQTFGADLNQEAFAMICTSSSCSCGKPIVIRTINGRRIPIHI